MDSNTGVALDKFRIPIHTLLNPLDGESIHFCGTLQRFWFLGNTQQISRGRGVRESRANGRVSGLMSLRRDVSLCIYSCFVIRLEGTWLRRGAWFDAAGPAVPLAFVLCPPALVDAIKVPLCRRYRGVYCGCKHRRSTDRHSASYAMMPI